MGLWQTEMGLRVKEKKAPRPGGIAMCGASLAQERQSPPKALIKRGPFPDVRVARSKLLNKGRARAFEVNHERKATYED